MYNKAENPEFIRKQKACSRFTQKASKWLKNSPNFGNLNSFREKTTTAPILVVKKETEEKSKTKHVNGIATCYRGDPIQRL